MSEATLDELGPVDSVIVGNLWGAAVTAVPRRRRI